jgi:hypothetical protein
MSTIEGMNDGGASGSEAGLGSTGKATQLTPLVAVLFQRWRLSTAEQRALLGLESEDECLPEAQRLGPFELARSDDAIARMEDLLHIHAALRLLFPDDSELRYSWVRRANGDLQGVTPLSLMIHTGHDGIKRVARLLAFQLHQ